MYHRPSTTASALSVRLLSLLQLFITRSLNATTTSSTSLQTLHQLSFAAPAQRSLNATPNVILQLLPFLFRVTTATALPSLTTAQCEVPEECGTMQLEAEL